MEAGDSSVASRTQALLEIAAAALIALLAGGLAIGMPWLVAESGFNPIQDFIQLSPVFFPRLTFGILAALAILYLARSVAALRAGGSRALTWWHPRYRNVVLIVMLATLYYHLLAWLGFSVATALMTVAGAALAGGGRWWHVAALALLAPPAIRFVFERLLLISLPRSEVDTIARLEEALMQWLTRVLT